MSKRQLGLLFLLAGAALAIGTIGVNVLGLGHFNGFGPAKQLALAAAGAIVLLGLSLIPLGRRPA